MNRKDWLLLAIGDSIEPIQLQKTLFKFAKESKVPATQQYRFEPYNWGPCAKQMYPHLAELRADGLVDFVPSGAGWSLYRLTPKGERHATRLRGIAPDRLVKELDRKRTWVKSRSFRKLLRDVYRDYPEFAKESLFEP